MKLQELTADEMKVTNGGGGDGEVYTTPTYGEDTSNDGASDGGPVHGYDPVDTFNRNWDDGNRHSGQR